MSIAETLKTMTPEQREDALEESARKRALREERAKRQAKRVIDAEEQGAHPPLQALTLQELFDRPTPQYVIDQVIPDTGLVQIVGEPGTLKTFFMCHIGLAVAAKQPQFFG